MGAAAPGMGAAGLEWGGGSRDGAAGLEWGGGSRITERHGDSGFPNGMGQGSRITDTGSHDPNVRETG